MLQTDATAQEQAAAASPPPVADPAAAATVRQLRSLLRTDDPAAMDYLQQHRASFQQLLGADFEALEKNTRGFEFEQALALLDAAGTSGPATAATP